MPKMSKKPKKKIVKVAYCCGVDWQHDIEGAMIKLYPTIKELKKDRTCWPECGIVSVKVSLDKWEAPQDFAYRKKVDPCAQ